MNKTKRIAFRIGIALAVLLAFTAPAMGYGVEGWLDPGDSAGEYGAADVFVYFNFTESVGETTGYQTDIYYDKDCVDIVSIDQSMSPFFYNFHNRFNATYNPGDTSWWPWLSPTSTCVRMLGSRFGTELPPGDYTFAVLHLRCNCSSNKCGSDLLQGWTEANNETGQPITGGHKYHDGTYTGGYRYKTVCDKEIDSVIFANATTGEEYAGATIGNYVGEDRVNASIILEPGVDVNAGDKIRVIACNTTSGNESNCYVTDHEVQGVNGAVEVDSLTLNHYCLNYYPTFPYRTWEQPNWSGPATMQMLVDHYRPEEPLQSYLNETGIAHNQACNADLLFVDPSGMRWTLNYILHNRFSYGGGKWANYGVGSSSTTIESVLHYICKWQYLGPGAAPAYGNYSNWMVIRGIHTNKTPSSTQGSYEIYGFWLNDPKDPGGIGENTYKSVEQWKSTYHLKLNKSDVNTGDYYYNRYVAVCEPPEDDDVEVTLAKPKPRLATAITPMLAEEPMMLYGIKQLALEKVVKDDESRKIVKAAIDGVNEELIPFDDNFASVFAKTVPGKPVLVTSDNGDYYVVPFNVPVKERLPVKKMPVEIERPKISGLKKLERMKRVANRIELKPMPIEPIRVEKTLVVVLVNAEDGSFKEASWVENPAKYLPVSKIEAMKLAVGEVLDELHVVAKKDARDLEVIQQRPTIELVYRDASPYYPDWKVTVNGKVFYVSQDGTVS